jgi:glycosyltransferase involved in cell wall biosynthesis
MDSLRDQDDQPDELVIALDHTEDDTLETITADITTRPVHFPVRILEVLAPRPEPFPASGTPDNCLFHAATGDILLHVDDDIALAPGTVRHARTLLHELPRAALWYLMTFVDENRRALAAGADWRLALASRLRLPLLPGGMMQPPATSSAFTGAIFATTRTALHAIGGHDMRHVGYHNQDTRLGNRLQLVHHRDAEPDRAPLRLDLAHAERHEHARASLRLRRDADRSDDCQRRRKVLVIGLLRDSLPRTET